MSEYKRCKLIFQDTKLSGISVMTMDPGGILDSRGHREQKLYIRIAFSILNVFLPLINLFTNGVGSSNKIGRDLVTLTTSPEYKDAKGYYCRLQKCEPTDVSKDEEKQRVLWNESIKWMGGCEGWEDMKDVMM